MRDLARLGRGECPRTSLRRARPPHKAVSGGAGLRKPSASRRRAATVTFLSSSTGGGPSPRPRATSSRPERRDLAASTTRLRPVVAPVVAPAAVPLRAVDDLELLE